MDRRDFFFLDLDRVVLDLLYSGSKMEVRMTMRMKVEIGMGTKVEMKMKMKLKILQKKKAAKFETGCLSKNKR